jgi:hypothetical protein
MKLKLVIACTRIWGYAHLNSISGLLQIIMVVSMILTSSTLGLFDYLHPKQVGAVEQRITNSPYDEVKSQVAPQSVIFDLPLKHAVKDNKNQIAQESLKQLLGLADSYVTKEATSVMEKKQIPPSGNNTIFFP